MKDNRSNMEIEEFIRASMEMTDVPAPELNQKLKATLYQQEAVLRKQPAAYTLSLWYLPMILILIQNVYLSYFAAGICLYVGVAGIVLTIVGAKRTNIKEDIAIRIEKRGVLA